MDKLMFLDAEADGGNEALTSFSDRLQCLIKDFLTWTRERGITNERLNYAYVFEVRKRRRGKLILSLTILEDNGCIITPEEKKRKR